MTVTSPVVIVAGTLRSHAFRSGARCACGATFTTPVLEAWRAHAAERIVARLAAVAAARKGAPKHPVPGPQTAPGAPQSPNPTTDTPGGQTGAQGREQEEQP